MASIGKMLGGALGGARRKRTEPVVADVGAPQAGDEGFTGPIRKRDKFKAGIRRWSAGAEKIRGKFAERQAKFGNRRGGY